MTHGEIRPLEGFEEFRACVALQEETWGRDFSERVPVAILRASQRLGGVVSGSFAPDGTLEGFVFGLTGIEEGEPVHWSDMLAVRPELRGAGLGRALKLYQRDTLLALGVRRVYWTFDPLEAGNAWLNLERLGVIAREYIEDAYGSSDSPLHEGIGTDRFVAIWELDSPRVRALVGKKAPGTEPAPATEEGTEGARGDRAGQPPATEPATRPALEPAERADPRTGLPRPGIPRLGLESDRLSVAIPSNIQALKGRDPDLAREWREATRPVLVHYLARGWEVRGLRRDEAAPGDRIAPGDRAAPGDEAAASAPGDRTITPHAMGVARYLLHRRDDEARRAHP